MTSTDTAPKPEDFAHWRGMVGKPLTAEIPLERDTLRRFAQAIMDSNKRYVDETIASHTRYKGLVAPPFIRFMLSGQALPHPTHSTWFKKTPMLMVQDKMTAYFLAYPLWSPLSRGF